MLILSTPAQPLHTLLVPRHSKSRKSITTLHKINLITTDFIPPSTPKNSKSKSLLPLKPNTLLSSVMLILDWRLSQLLHSSRISMTPTPSLHLMTLHAITNNSVPSSTWTTPPLKAYGSVLAHVRSMLTLQVTLSQTPPSNGSPWKYLTRLVVTIVHALHGVNRVQSISIRLWKLQSPSHCRQKETQTQSYCASCWIPWLVLPMLLQLPTIINVILQQLHHLDAF
jgi:hypothetical protein